MPSETGIANEGASQKTNAPISVSLSNKINENINSMSKKRKVGMKKEGKKEGNKLYKERKKETNNIQLCHTFERCGTTILKVSLT